MPLLALPAVFDGGEDDWRVGGCRELRMSAWLSADGDEPDLACGVDPQGRIVRESLAPGHDEEGLSGRLMGQGCRVGGGWVWRNGGWGRGTESRWRVEATERESLLGERAQGGARVSELIGSCFAASGKGGDEAAGAARR